MTTDAPEERRALVGLCREAAEGDILVSDWFVPFGCADTASLLQLASRCLRVTRPYEVIGRILCAGLWPLPEDEPLALLFDARAPGHIALVVDLQPGTNALVGLWPVLEGTSQMGVRVEAVWRSADRLTALIEGVALGYLDVTFHDPFYLGNRGFYGAGRHHDFVLTGLALSFAAAPDHVLRIPAGTPGWRAIVERMDSSGLADDGSIELHTEGMMLFMPREGLAPNAYEIAGRVVSVRPATGGETLGRPLWLVRVRCAEAVFDDLRFTELDVSVTDLVLGDLPLPQIGDAVEAVVLLQGKVWHPDTPPPRAAG